MTRAEQWYRQRTYHHRDYSPERTAEAKTDTVTVCVPARETAGTIGAIVESLLDLRERKVIDAVMVVDAGSADGTAEVAARAGAEVHQEAALVPEFGPPLGKGDAMWRALSVAYGDIVVFMDADTADPDPAHLLGLLGPLLGDPDVHFVKAAFERPFRTPDGVVAHEGGRVTELMARPLLNLHFPALAGFSQPLAGETAARRDLLRSLPFAAGYGVEIGLLIDALRRVGLDGLAEAHVGTRQNRHQSLRALSAMAFAVLVAVERRVARDAAEAPVAHGLVQPWDGDSVRDVPVEERPPLREVLGSADGATAR